jgi:hypothetical protein
VPILAIAEYQFRGSMQAGIAIPLQGADVNLKVMSVLPGFRYSLVAAAGVTRHETGERLTVDPSPQIPRLQASVALRRGLAYSGKLGWICMCH